MAYRYDPKIKCIAEEVYISAWIKDGGKMARMKITKIALGELSKSSTPQFANFKKVLKEHGNELAKIADNKIRNGQIEDEQHVEDGQEFDVVLINTADLGI